MEGTSEEHQNVIVVSDDEKLDVNAGSPQLEMTEVAFDEELMNTIDVTEEMEGEVDEFECTVSGQYEQNILYDLYQPLEADDVFLCKICHQLGKNVVFEDRQQYASHRYKVHGSFNNSVVCPMENCKEAFASTIQLRRHLTQTHDLPIEIHHQVFYNIGEFERWRHMVELASNSRFVMYTKQPNKKRQILHCAKSEHKLILHSKRHRLPRNRMQKEGTCCPAVISFRVDDRSGNVHAFYQLFHVGHASQLPGEHEINNDMTPRLAALHFPEAPSFVGERGMQYLQIDLIEMENTVYHSVIYSHLLVIRDLFSGFTWAKPMPDPVSKQLIVRILTDKFCEYGIPDGYSCSGSFSPRVIKEAISSISDVFQVQIREIHHEAPDYDTFRSVLIDTAVTDLKSSMRWVETVQFAVMEMNQAGKKSAFERFFNRRPHSSFPLSYLPPEAANHDDLVDEDDGFPPPAVVRYDPCSTVFLRNIDFRNGRGGLPLPYLYGLIGTVDWEKNPSFPYKVHYSKVNDPGPTETSPFVWAPPHYVLPTSQDLFQIKGEERQKIVANLMCCCRERMRDEHCMLFRSFLCSNAMAKACCALSGKKCAYHESVSGDDSYVKMEKLTKLHSRECHVEEKPIIDESWRFRKIREEHSPPGHQVVIDVDDVSPGPSMVEDFCVEVAAEEVISEETVTDSGVIGLREYSPVEPNSPPPKRHRMASGDSGSGGHIIFRCDQPPPPPPPDYAQIHSEEQSTSQFNPAEPVQYSFAPEEVLPADLLPESSLVTGVPQPRPFPVQSLPSVIPGAPAPSVSLQRSRSLQPNLQAQPTRRSQRATKAKVFADFVTD